MLEGNEIEKSVGSGGKAVVDVSGQGIVTAKIEWQEGTVKAGMSIEWDMIAELQKLVARTDNKIDDQLLGMIKLALGRV